MLVGAFVVLFAALGGLLRFYFVETLVNSESVFPLNIFLINIIGCFFVGILFKVVSYFEVSNTLSLIFIVGFFGAFTTFSGFALEIVKLLLLNLYKQAFTYFFSTNLCCIVAIFFGIKLVDLINWIKQ